jgi:hypothetical protein
MKTITERDLVLHYYGEAADGEAITAALERIPELADRYREIRSVLDAAATVESEEPLAGYESRLWRQLEPRLVESPARRRHWPGAHLDRGWVVVAAALVVLAAAFLAGRLSTPPATPAVATPSQRILLVTVVDHLQRTEQLFLELANAGDGTHEFEAERALANDLSSANDLYRQAARRQGDLRTAALLDELQWMLLEIARSPDVLEPEELAELRHRLDDRDLLFKVQIVRSRLQHADESQRRRSQPASV